MRKHRIYCKVRARAPGRSHPLRRLLPERLLVGPLFPERFWDVTVNQNRRRQLSKRVILG